jgi:hypothetical protein
MKSHKERLTVTVDPALVQAGTEAVAAGHAVSLSAWVNLALAERVAKEERLRAMGDAIAAYEAEFGAISAEELAAQGRADRRFARVIRGAGRTSRPKPRAPRRRGAA